MLNDKTCFPLSRQQGRAAKQTLRGMWAADDLAAPLGAQLG